MHCDILINFVGNNNEESVLCTEYMKPKEAVFIYKDNDKIENLKKYFMHTYPNIIFTGIKMDNNRKINEIIGKYMGKNVIIDISAADKSVSLEVLYEAFKRRIEVVFMDINKKELTKFGESQIEKIKVNLADIDINEIMKTLGAKILLESTEIGEEEIVSKLTMLIAGNMKQWNEIRPVITDNTTLIHYEDDPYKIGIKMEKLNKNQKRIVLDTIDLLQKYKQINCMRNSDDIEIKFLNNFIKGFIFKTGSWFEVFTKMVVEEIDFIDDVKSGMMFLWDKNQRKIKNEIDVVAIKDGVLICISCKDSSKYDENALNELNVYAEKIGGENAVKILTATKMPSKISIIDRAAEMGIDIIVYNGNKNDFKEAIRDCILKKTVR
ncbi:MAG: DUF1887 family CARF protein [Inconstantimicrobium porci]|uniref:Card1-like endonuclease domain-containing protein n=1 Tax=Inconstantimicrobium porci TaxID=2652291 RepID=UPI002A9140BC|nr:DUF1887 family CARF protein [Inconstantimicrobium porci]MDY5911476.1 DUF1887 family CARF protein [Inconstantimicrobium porci]